MELNSKDSARMELSSKGNYIFKTGSFTRDNFFWINFMEKEKLLFLRIK